MFFFVAGHSAILGEIQTLMCEFFWELTFLRWAEATRIEEDSLMDEGIGQVRQIGDVLKFSNTFCGLRLLRILRIFRIFRVMRQPDAQHSKRSLVGSDRRCLRWGLTFPGIHRTTA